MCTRKRDPEYRHLSEHSTAHRALHRIREAVQTVNIMLPTPITLEMAVLSADGIRKLVRGQSLARTYSQCLRNLDCLSQHVPGNGNPGLDAVVATHRENAQRVADTCAAALLHMYMSVDAGQTDAFVEHAIQLTAATETAMSDIALVEKALGLRHDRDDRCTSIDYDSDKIVDGNALADSQNSDAVHGCAIAVVDEVIPENNIPPTTVGKERPTDPTSRVLRGEARKAGKLLTVNSLASDL
ncbi:UL51 virion phosphoprotein [Meleagrid alphaherpesvirus 1]|uniref:UL51 virion phosphoprotein n=1 Tax=Meleagrid herpesvirus 1 TaxID=37108 RepID=Q9DPP9_MEHV1|nr:tegument protein UL51 [Meleagrid alphaherpesvirus 1]AKQ48634.1 tegument protein UL51 [iBAC vector pMeHV1-C7]AKQ48706.1 tegument protein UL51 [iBAC vector pMeHV1-C9]AKQ48778.1 tegument protein UL51 [iBAC vector pMeHV1-C10]AKQ48850.1 tegument protein UL51 [iBAC vector pMeHV1-C17]AKQ48923.1 tegument protein UL51 [iBAC vector pMeHV1-C18]